MIASPSHGRPLETCAYVCTIYLIVCVYLIDYLLGKKLSFYRKGFINSAWTENLVPLISFDPRIIWNSNEASLST